MKRKTSEVVITNAVEKYMHAVQEVVGDELAMAALYGSAATGDYVLGVSDVNLLFVVEAPSPKHLFELGEKTRGITRKYRVTAHVLSKQELVSSADVFPVEYLEIGSTMELIHGTDLITSLEVHTHNLRHQVESMIRGEINSLRQLIITLSARQRELAEELRMWSGRQAALFRALLRLTGGKQKAEARDLRQVIEHIADTFSVSAKPFLELEDVREGIKVTRSIQDIAGDILLNYISIAEIIDGPTYR